MTDSFDNFENLREPMSMPDPRFPIKVHRTHFEHADTTLFAHHWHAHLEFHYIEAGEAVMECGTTAYEVQPGDLIVVNSNELHHGVSRSSDLFYYALIVDTSLLHSQFEDAADTKFIAPIIQNRILFRNHIRGNAELNACVLSIAHELKTRSFGFELAVKSELYRLLTLLMRGHVASVLTKDEYAERMKNIERFEPVLHYIDLHFKEPLGVELLSEIAGLSRFHFSRVFKQLTGRTVTEYVTATRLDKAEYMLRHSPLTISEIAAATGFNDIFYFSRTFKKHKKQSPSRLRDV
ncbi:AraC family transcriptional regulator [Paenibacillus sp. MY03]|jgi:AraC-like DNA-binding protein|uniref:AraC family transcriptional regulator n=1 Tax=Paenibacillus agaridevorans TaxID=171404 RepID=A0A2R5ESW4_9BACL|nr:MULTISPECIES: AraC family transcriptional regulator [Paenibacillus]OUS78698.1 AraC family transcriptional regulator [Paenibacillus sp. MY03]GBG09786.1 AraC family transcriptional regulator [Paenibacillus agaridevorans]